MDDFVEISKTYDDIHLRVISIIHRFLADKYYDRCIGGRVLDIGNGGQPAVEVVGERVAPTLAHFVGLDRSFSMLSRKTEPFARVAGDGSRMPFRDDAFDFGIVNGVIHHLGVDPEGKGYRPVQSFLHEALRVCARGLIVYELFTHPVLERLERLAVKLGVRPPAYVYSERAFDACLREIGLERLEVASRTLADLTEPFYWYAVTMEYPWIRLPAVLSPFRHGFFVVPKPGRRSREA
jgi:ubiquinone/menaquinone biosynthesis C-methylase UbiE